MASLFTGFLVCGVCTAIWPANYDFEGTRNIAVYSDKEAILTAEGFSMPSKEDDITKSEGVAQVQSAYGATHLSKEDDEAMGALNLEKNTRQAIIYGVGCGMVVLLFSMLMARMCKVRSG